MADTGFEWYDYLIFIATLVVSLGIGLYFSFAGGKQRTTKEYLMGNRQLGVVPVALSMFMSYISAILVLGNTAEMVMYGTEYWLACIGSSLAFVSSGLIFVPLFYPLKLTSSFKYLEMRFKSQAVKVTGTLLLMTSQIIYMGLAMYSPATALESVTPIPTWAAIIATGVVATVYTTVGGIKAVVWTDVFQAGVMVVGLIIVLAVGSDKVGGFGEVWRIAGEGDRRDMWDFTTDPFVRISFWSLVIGRFVSSTQTVGTGQTSVQRYCALPTKRKAQITVLLNVPLMILLYTLTCACGLVVYAYYTVEGCDPLRNGDITSENQYLPYFIANALETPGLPGLFVAVIFSGALSTLSSSLNSLSAVAWKDLIEWKFKDISESRKALATKLLVVMFGAIAIGMAFMGDSIGGHVLQASNSFVSGTAGPLLGIFVLGAFFPFANWKGALVGGWGGLAFALTVTIGAYVETPFRSHKDTATWNCTAEIEPIPTDPEGVFAWFRISFMWFATLGTVSCVVFGVIISLLTGPEDPRKADPRLHIPIADRILCCLPLSFRRMLWCTVPHHTKQYDDQGNYITEEDKIRRMNSQNIYIYNAEDKSQTYEEIDPKDLKMSTIANGYVQDKSQVSNGHAYENFAAVFDDHDSISTRKSSTSAGSDSEDEYQNTHF